ncbi:MAG: DUF3617 family protein [Caldimonas sp.]
MKHLKTVILFGLAAASVLCAPSVQAADRMKSGLWEMTSTNGGAAHTGSTCAAPDTVKLINGTPSELRAFVESTNAQAKCRVQNYKLDGDVESYTAVCGGSSTDITTTYHGDSYKMVMTTKGDAGVSTSQIQARRLGPCP